MSKFKAGDTVYLWSSTFIEYEEHLLTEEEHSIQLEHDVFNKLHETEEDWDEKFLGSFVLQRHQEVIHES